MACIFALGELGKELHETGEHGLFPNIIWVDLAEGILGMLTRDYVHPGSWNPLHYMYENHPACHWIRGQCLRHCPLY